MAAWGFGERSVHFSRPRPYGGPSPFYITTRISSRPRKAGDRKASCLLQMIRVGTVPKSRQRRDPLCQNIRADFCIAAVLPKQRRDVLDLLMQQPRYARTSRTEQSERASVGWYIGNVKLTRSERPRHAGTALKGEKDSLAGECTARLDRLARPTFKRSSSPLLCAHRLATVANWGAGQP